MQSTVANFLTVRLYRGPRNRGGCGKTGYEWTNRIFSFNVQYGFRKKNISEKLPLFFDIYSRLTLTIKAIVLKN